MVRVLNFFVALATGVLASCATAHGQGGPPLPTPIEAPDRQSIPLHAAAAAAQPEQWEAFMQQEAVRNVTAAALYPVLPAQGTSNGRAVLIVPGGGYRFVSMDSEGFRVAERLAAAGYTAFVLKYRTMRTPRDARAYMAELAPIFQNLGQRELEDLPEAVADLAAAVSLLRTRAGEWGVDPHAINVIGFSAGARSLIRYLEQGRDDGGLQSAALIYPPMREAVRPGARPNLFLAIAADDPLFRAGGFGLPQQWLADGAGLEFHLYAGGSHGFGMRPMQTTSDHWIEHYQVWLSHQGASR